MIDREKIIRGLEICRHRVISQENCKECPYIYDGRAKQSNCEGVLHWDALSLLKTELEHREDAYWLEDSDPGETIGAHWACSNCKVCFGEQEKWNPIERGWHFCPSCGARMNGVKWE